MMIGAGAAVQLGVGPQAPYKGAPVLVITSDAGITYSMFELDTAAKYKIPIVAVVYNNNAWGMWPSAVGTPRSMHMYLFQENLRYDKMAEGLGRARRIRAHAGRIPQGAEDQLRSGGQGTRVHADQRAGAEGIHVGQGLSAGQHHQSRAECGSACALRVRSSGLPKRFRRNRKLDRRAGHRDSGRLRGEGCFSRLQRASRSPGTSHLSDGLAS